METRATIQNLLPFLKEKCQGRGWNFLEKPEKLSVSTAYDKLVLLQQCPGLVAVQVLQVIGITVAGNWFPVSQLGQKKQTPCSALSGAGTTTTYSSDHTAIRKTFTKSINQQGKSCSGRQRWAVHLKQSSMLSRRELRCISGWCPVILQ